MVAVSDTPFDERQVVVRDEHSGQRLRLAMVRYLASGCPAPPAAIEARSTQHCGVRRSIGRSGENGGTVELTTLRLIGSPAVDLSTGYVLAAILWWMSFVNGDKPARSMLVRKLSDRLGGIGADRIVESGGNLSKCLS
jgi:hypothetical protein